MVNSNDIIHYYLGSKFHFKWNNSKDEVIGLLSSVNDSGMLFAESAPPSNDFIEINDYRTDGQLKLILIHPSDMSIHERRAYYKLCQPRYWQGRKWIADTPESLHYLFVHSVDAFGLLERGAAINANAYSIAEKLPNKKEERLEPEPTVDYSKKEAELFTAVKHDKPYEFYVPYNEMIKSK